MGVLEIKSKIIKMNYITCDILGPGTGQFNFGLCNQMFQVAALTSHAYDDGLTAIFPQIKTPQYGGYDKNIMSRVNSEDINTSNFKYIEIPFGYHKLSEKCNICYKGYMQSEKYFVHNRQLILDLFAPTEEIKQYIETKYGELLKSNLMSMHIRRGDYVHQPNHHPVTSPEYYLTAAEYITSRTAVDKYVIFSDDIEWCKEIFGTDQNVVYIEGEADYIDLYLMSMCKHNIIANSTFSWWGAWLNNNPDKIVVAPTEWFGSARTNLNTADIIPQTWIKL
jgi:hypothetical protein